MSSTYCPICGTWFARSTERDRHLETEHRHLLGSHQVGLGPEASRPPGVRFADRQDAGRRLARRVDLLHVPDPLVIAIPRGGVPVAYEVAAALAAPLEVVVVSRLRDPHRPEVGLGAVAEGGFQVVDAEALETAHLDERELAAIVERERDLLPGRVQTLRGDRLLEPLTGRSALMVDDGITTGSTARAACRLLRDLGVDRIVLAVPVAIAGTARQLAEPGGADVVVSLTTPDRLSTIGQQYESFAPVRDRDIADLLRRARARPEVPA